MIKRRLLGVLAAAVALTLCGCAAPDFTYVTNSTSHTYFKVPNDWHKIGDAALTKVVASSGNSTGSAWTVGYDASRKPDAGNAFSSLTSAPFAYAVVGQLSSSSVNSMSYDQLQDFFLPVTSTARQSASKSGFPLTGFKLLTETKLTPGQGVHGVWVTFEYTYPDGSTDTFGQVALTNADDTEVYVLLVHCLATCYSTHKDEIDTVMKSFTVRSPG